MKIVLAGPPRSGKSCLRYALPKAVRQASLDRHYLLVLKGAPDGEGAWFHEACERDMQEAFGMRDKYKYAITREFAQRVAREVELCDAPLTAIDIGGRVSDENRLICRHATHIVMIAGDHPQYGSWDERLNEWRAFAKELNLKTIAELHSCYDACEDQIIGNDAGILRAIVHHLERGDECLDQRPAVVALANHILAQL